MRLWHAHKNERLLWKILPLWRVYNKNIWKFPCTGWIFFQQFFKFSTELISGGGGECFNHNRDSPRAISLSEWALPPYVGHSQRLALLLSFRRSGTTIVDGRCKHRKRKLINKGKNRSKKWKLGCSQWRLTLFHEQYLRASSQKIPSTLHLQKSRGISWKMQGVLVQRNKA